MQQRRDLGAHEALKLGDLVRIPRPAGSWVRITPSWGHEWIGQTVGEYAHGNGLDASAPEGVARRWEEEQACGT